MKKVVSVLSIMIFMFATTIGLCFGAEITDSGANVSVMATVSATFEVSEKITVNCATYSKTATVSDLTVTNLTSDRTVKVEKIEAESAGTWQVVSSDVLAAASQDEQCICLSIDGQSLSDGYAPVSGEITGNKASKAFVISGEIPVQTHTMENTEIAKLVVTLSVIAVSAEENTGAGETFNGYTVDYLKKYVTWAKGTDDEVAAVIKAIDAGELEVDELTGWDVGTIRKIKLGAIESGYLFEDTDGTSFGGTTEDQPEQYAYLVIMAASGSKACKSKIWWKDDTTPKTASFIVGFRTFLQTAGCMNSSALTTGASWKSCDRRGWLNSTFYEAMLEAMHVTEEDNFFKLVKNATGTYDADDTTNGGMPEYTYDYFFLPSAKEVGCGSESIQSPMEDFLSEEILYDRYGAQKTIMSSSGDRDVVLGWLRTVYIKSINSFAYAGINANTNSSYCFGVNASASLYGSSVCLGIAPYFCL